MRGLLVGYGSIGRRHLANLHQLGIDDWAVVRTGLGTLPFEPPVAVRTYDDLATALRQERPAFAVVANPTNLHVETTLACLEAGCAVLVEKPVATTAEGVGRLEAVAGAAADRVLVGFQFRYHPALRRIASIVRDGTAGRPVHARVVWAEHLPSWHPWEDHRQGYAARPELGGGVHHTICHPVDYLRMLFGEPEVVDAALVVDGPLGLPVAESADALLEFPGSLLVQLHLDYWAQPMLHRVEVTTTETSIRWDYGAADFAVWDRAEVCWRGETHPGLDARNDLFLAQSQHFLDVVAGRARPACTLTDGLAAARVCLAIEAAAAGRGEVRR